MLTVRAFLAIVVTERVRAWQGDRRTDAIREALPIDTAGAPAFDAAERRAAADRHAAHAP